LFTDFSPSQATDFHNSFTVQAAQRQHRNAEEKVLQNDPWANDSNWSLHSLSRSFPQPGARIPQPASG
jgi:hypothetical protein